MRGNQEEGPVSLMCWWPTYIGYRCPEVRSGSSPPVTACLHAMAAWLLRSVFILTSCKPYMQTQGTVRPRSNWGDPELAEITKKCLYIRRYFSFNQGSVVPSGLGGPEGILKLLYVCFNTQVPVLSKLMSNIHTRARKAAIWTCRVLWQPLGSDPLLFGYLPSKSVLEPIVCLIWTSNCCCCLLCVPWAKTSNLGLSFFLFKLSIQGQNHWGKKLLILQWWMPKYWIKAAL